MAGSLRWAAAAGILIGVVALSHPRVLPTFRGDPPRTSSPRTAGSPPPAKLSIETRPPGALAIVDGVERGTTPLTLALVAGAHSLELRQGSNIRSVPLTLKPGVELVEYVELASSVSGSEPRHPSVEKGRLSVATDPPGAKVHVDGRLGGTSPVTLELAPGTHRVSVAARTGTAERTIAVAPGATASIVFSLPAASSAAAGYLSVSAPFDLQIFEGAELVGVSGAARTMLPAGSHDLRLVNQTLEYEEVRQVEIAAGKVTAVVIAPPSARVSANAKPWAEVFVDGASVGQTPLANLSLPIGTHEVVFRHPQLGEERRTIIVTSRGPNRISADLTRQ